MLGGARSKPHSIWNYIMFIFIAKHYNSRFKLENSGETVHCYYYNETDDSN